MRAYKLHVITRERWMLLLQDKTIAACRGKYYIMAIFEDYPKDIAAHTAVFEIPKLNG